MVGHSHMIAPPRGAHMTRNPLATMEYLDGPATDANIDLLFDQGEGHGIPGTVNFNMVVGGHAGALPTGEDIGVRRQELKAWTVQGGEQIGTAGAIPTHHAHIQLVQKPSDRYVQFRQ